MKKVLMLLAMMAATGVTQAAEETNDVAQTYIANLCTTISQEESPATTDAYLAQLRNMTARGQSPSSLSSAGFDEDEARTVIAAWMNLSEAQKNQVRHNPDACQEAILNEYQSPD